MKPRSMHITTNWATPNNRVSTLCGRVAFKSKAGVVNAPLASLQPPCRSCCRVGKSKATTTTPGGIAIGKHDWIILYKEERR